MEHTTGRLRVLQALTQVNRHGRRKHEVRVRAVAGLVNRLIDELIDARAAGLARPAVHARAAA